MKVLEYILNSIVWDQVSIVEIQFRFMPGKVTTNSILTLRQLKIKFMQRKKYTYYAFADLEKAFDYVPQCILRVWKIEKLVIQVVKSV